MTTPGVSEREDDPAASSDRDDVVRSASGEPQGPRRSKARAALALIRVPHWTKNAFVLAPLFFSKKFDDIDAIVLSLGATLAFSLVASAIYVVNDWADRHEDARHPIKHDRPLARRELGGADAVAIGIACLALAAMVGLLVGLPAGCWGVIAIYAAINLAYSRALRDVELIDVCVIAAGFVLRVLAGTTALSVEASQWIILSTGLLALLLGLAKRRTDLAQETAASRRSLTGYSVEFIDTAMSTLAAAVIGFYSLFTVSAYATQRFGSDHLYLTTFWVAVGVLRYLQVVIGEARLGSPTDIALRDRPLQFVIVGWLATFYVLSFGS